MGTVGGLSRHSLTGLRSLRVGRLTSLHACLAGAVVAAFAGACTDHSGHPEGAQPAADRVARADSLVFAGVAGRFRAADPGACGRLERFAIDIRPPAQFIEPEDCPLQVYPWILPKFTPETVASQFDLAGLTGSLRERFDAAVRCQPEACAITVDLDLLRSLDDKARGILFPTAGRFPENPTYFNSFRRPEGDIDHWLASSELSERGRAVVRSLLYRQGANLHFASQPIACAQFDDADKVALMRALSMTRSVLVKVRLDSDADVARIAGYWGNGRRNKDIGALLASLRESGAESLDIIHLLPPFARKRLFTFPGPGSLPWDCHWTAMNFFNENGDDRFLDAERIIEDFNTRYRQVSTEALEFGDVLTFIADGNAYHSVVYIADDLVFTKNGRSFWRPWTLMTLEESIRYYKTQSQMQIRAFRRIDQDSPE